MIKCEGCQREPGEYEGYAYGDAAPTKWLALVKQMRDSDNHSVLTHMRVFCSEECVRAFYAVPAHTTQHLSAELGYDARAQRNSPP